MRYELVNNAVVAREGCVTGFLSCEGRWTKGE
jgi:hypothetical protein